MAGFVPWPTRFFVPSAKIAYDLLDGSSPEGASKGRYLASYGFDASAPHLLEAALLDHAVAAHFIGAQITQWGLKFRFDGPLHAPNGRDARVLSVWQMDADTGDAARFVTLRPSRRG